MTQLLWMGLRICMAPACTVPKAYGKDKWISAAAGPALPVSVIKHSKTFFLSFIVSLHRRKLPAAIEQSAAFTLHYSASRGNL